VAGDRDRLVRSDVAGVEGQMTSAGEAQNVLLTDPVAQGTTGCCPSAAPPPSGRWLAGSPSTRPWPGATWVRPPDRSSSACRRRRSRVGPASPSARSMFAFSISRRAFPAHGRRAAVPPYGRASTRLFRAGRVSQRPAAPGRNARVRRLRRNGSGNGQQARCERWRRCLLRSRADEWDEADQQCHRTCPPAALLLCQRGHHDAANSRSARSRGPRGRAE
jgi:hypothetical protein